MSILLKLSDEIKRFWQLPHHHDAKLANKLIEVQQWQRQRITKTHQHLFNQPQNKALADYFLLRLYGGPEFEALLRQLERIVDKTHKIERFAPTAALEAGSMTINAAIKATELDLHLAEWLYAQNLPVNAINMLKAYQAVDEADERRVQNQSLKDICYRIDKYVNSFVIQRAFKMLKKTAYKYNFNLLYDFMAEGFDAMKPLNNVADFIEPFCEREFVIIDHVHDRTNHDSVEPDWKQLNISYTYSNDKK